MVMADPTQFYRSHVFFTLSPGTIVEGDPEFHAKLKEVFFQRGKTYIQVGGPTQQTMDFAKQARGGSFVIEIGTRGVSYHVVYLYTQGGSTTTGQIQEPTVNQQPSTSTLGNPIVSHKMISEQQIYWMELRVPGETGIFLEVSVRP